MDTCGARKYEIAHTERRVDKAVIDAERRWTRLDQEEARAELFDGKARENASAYRCNIESYVGTVNIPVGIAGPLRIHGRNGTNDYRTG